MSGHLAVKQVLCAVGITQHLGLLCAQFHDFQNDGVVIIFVAVIAAGRISLEHLLAQRAVLGGGHGGPGMKT